MESTESIKLPKNTKENRYYYKHREEILAKNREKRLQDPEYHAKFIAKEQAKKDKEARDQQRLTALLAKTTAQQHKKTQLETKRKLKEQLLGLSPGANETAIII